MRRCSFWRAAASPPPPSAPDPRRREAFFFQVCKDSFRGLPPEQKVFAKRQILHIRTQPCSCMSSRSAPCSTRLGAHPCSPRAAACCVLSGPQPCAWLLGLRGRLRGAAAVAACRVLGGSAPPCRSNRRRGHLRGAAAVAVCRVLGAGVIAGAIAGCTGFRGAARRDTRRSERPWLCVCV